MNSIRNITLMLLVISFAACDKNSTLQPEILTEAQVLSSISASDFIGPKNFGEYSDDKITHHSFEANIVPDTTANDIKVLAGTQGKILQVDGDYLIQTPSGKKYHILMKDGQRLESSDGYVRIVKDPTLVRQEVDTDLRDKIDRMLEGHE